jgi:hypothetical protein
LLSLVVSTGTYAPKNAPAQGLNARAANALVAAVILGLFVLGAIVSAVRKDITQDFDEIAHAFSGYLVYFA